MVIYSRANQAPVLTTGAGTGRTDFAPKLGSSAACTPGNCPIYPDRYRKIFRKPSFGECSLNHIGILIVMRKNSLMKGVFRSGKLTAQSMCIYIYTSIYMYIHVHVQPFKISLLPLLVVFFLSSYFEIGPSPLL